LQPKRSSIKQAEAVSLRPESFEILVYAKIFIDKIRNLPIAFSELDFGRLSGRRIPICKNFSKDKLGPVCYLQRNPDAPLAGNERKPDFTGQRSSGRGFMV
jgi:hypothetical protein